jgi:hypothetical protein
MTDHDARARLGAALRGDLVRASREEEPIAYETLEAYVDDTLDGVEREILETRLADDAVLRAEVEELRALRRELAPRAETEREARTSPVLSFEDGAKRSAARSRKRLSVIAPLLAAAAAVIVVVWAGTAWQTGSRQQSREDRLAGGSGPATPAPAPSATPPVAAASAKLTLRDGNRLVTLTADDTLGGLDGADPALRAGITQMLTTGRLPEAPRDLAAARGQLLAPAGQAGGAGAQAPAFAVRTPVATVVRDPRPVFSWTAVRNASAYRVRIVDASLDLVAESDRLMTTTWRPAQALPRGRVLQWQVEAETPTGSLLTPAPPAPEALFRILSADAAARLDQEIAASGGSTLASIWILTRAGLRDEAAAALDSLAAANVTASAVEQVLLRRLRESLQAR